MRHGGLVLKVGRYRNYQIEIPVIAVASSFQLDLVGFNVVF